MMAMRKLYVFMMVSLDGYFEGPKHELDWHNVDKKFNEFAAAQLNETGDILFGRKTYQLMESYWPTEKGKKDDPLVAAKMNELPKTVFSKTLEKPKWNNTRLVTKNISEEVEKLKQQPGKDIAIFGSSNLCVSFMEMGLIDELRIMVNPVVLGEGHTVFGGIKGKLKLKLQKTMSFNSGNVLLNYSPVK
jgi:dihydrofolate reductase